MAELTPAGATFSITLEGAPSPEFGPNTYTVADGRDGYLYGSGQVDWRTGVGVIYRTPLSVLGVPTNVRIIRGNAGVIY